MAEARDAGVIAFTCNCGKNADTFADTADPAIVIVHRGFIDYFEIIGRHSHYVRDAANAIGEVLRS